MPYANIESRRKYQRDAYQKKKLEYSAQRLRLNENETNKLYNELVKQRLKEKAEYQFKPDEDLKNEITKELKTINPPKNYEWVKNQLTSLKDMADFSFTIDSDEIKRDERYKKIDDLKTQLRNIEDRDEKKEESTKYKIEFIEDDGTKELERHLKNNWIKRQLKELNEMANFQFEQDGDLIKLNERLKKMDYLRIQLKETPPIVEPYKINNELDFLTFMSKYKPKNKIFYLAPISSEFLKEFAPDYWSKCVKNKFMPLDTFKKCIL